MEYLDDQIKTNKAFADFKTAFTNVENATIIKSQKNSFALYVKYPLILFLLILVVATVYIIQLTVGYYDALYIVCEIVLTIGLTFVSIVLIRTWIRVISNAKVAEEIVYYNKDVRCHVVDVKYAGEKIECENGSLYIEGDDFELIEGEGKEYKAYYYKNMHGHSRGYLATNIEWLEKVFFVGAKVLADDENGVLLSSGFRFKISHNQLSSYTICGFYDECYENNFGIVSFMSQSKSYQFEYKFKEVNSPSFRLMLPVRSREGARLFGLDLPEHRNIIIR